MPVFLLNPRPRAADLVVMHILALFFALQVATSGEMACLGTLQDVSIPADLHIAGVQKEGLAAYGVEGQYVFLNGPRVSSLRVGDIRRVLRLEGKVHDPLSGDPRGLYYRDIGTIRVETVGPKSAAARILTSCQGVMKGDLAVPSAPTAMVVFRGDFSNAVTPIPSDSLVGPILLGKEDARELAAGSFCFIGVGARDGVQPGDRFTVFRPYPPFDSKDMDVDGKRANASYSPMRNSYLYRYQWMQVLKQRSLPPQVLGDIVVVQTGDRVSAGRIVSSLSEIHPGDLVVKR
jgi:hypothetical protein